LFLGDSIAQPNDGVTVFEPVHGDGSQRLRRCVQLADSFEDIFPLGISLYEKQEIVDPTIGVRIIDELIKLVIELGRLNEILQLARSGFIEFACERSPVKDGVEYEPEFPPL
jgi:hypothetical protein